MAAGVLLDDAAAEDVAQEAMLSAIRGLDRFESRRRFEPWLVRIVVNRALDELRSRGRRPLPVERVQDSDATAPSEITSLPPQLVAALSLLGEREREIVVLRHLGELTSSEIGAILELKPATVRSTLARSLEELRRALEPSPEGGAEHE